MYSVPSSALPTPPPASPTGLGSSVKKYQESPAAPLLTTSQSTETSGMKATAKHTAQTTAMPRSTNFR